MTRQELEDKLVTKLRAHAAYLQIAETNIKPVVVKANFASAPWLALTVLPAGESEYAMSKGYDCDVIITLKNKSRSSETEDQKDLTAHWERLKRVLDLHFSEDIRELSITFMGQGTTESNIAINARATVRYAEPEVS